jgi:hypothetical protein
MDAPVDAHFASFPAGVSEAGNVSSDVDEDVGDLATEPMSEASWITVSRSLLTGRRFRKAYEEADNKSARTNYDFVREEVARLLESGQVVEWDVKPRCCNPLTVAVKHLDNGGGLKSTWF